MKYLLNQLLIILSFPQTINTPENISLIMERVETTSSTTEYYFPKLPGKDTNGAKIDLAANYFRFSFLNNTVKCFFKYAVDFEPELPGDARELRRKIWRLAQEEVKKHLKHTIFNNTTCYSQENVSEPINVPITLDDQKYTLWLRWANQVSNDSLEALSLYKKFFGQIVRRLHFVPMRRNYFNSKNAVTVDNLEVWPGFNSAINIFPEGILLNLNVIHKVLRPETALEALNKIKNNYKNSDECFSAIQEAFKGTIVLTRYNNDKTYAIDQVDLSKTPNDTFLCKDKEISYIQYYQEKYGRAIADKNQPLFVSKDKKTNRDLYLIPEFCFLTGLTDEMRSNFNLMKRLDGITKGNPGTKMKECMNLIDTFLKNEKCAQDINTWGITITPKPVTLTARRLQAGNILMHKNQSGRFSINIDSADDIDRKIQTEMYNQPPVSKWILMATRKDSNAVSSFLSTFEQVKGSFRYNIAMPKEITVDSPNFKDWETAITKNVTLECQAVVLIIPGSKGRPNIYSEVKRLLTAKIPVPSQVVLAGTILKPKGLRSVLNKVLIQICAKVGGEPWAVDRMPFCSIPTMIVGIDIHSKGNKSYIGCCGTYNNTFTRYHAVCSCENKDGDLSTKVADSIQELINNFKSFNKLAPQHIIILRDGISPTQVQIIAAKEVDTILKTVESNIKVTYIALNKKNTLKVFEVSGNCYNNIPPGTMVDDIVVDQNKYEFFLISQKTNMGLAQATHYQVVYDNFNVRPEDIHSFIYKQCYLYYNWTGGIKIPAPCQYAKKLAVLVGDKLSAKESVFPESRFNKELRSLYFL